MQYVNDYGMMACAIKKYLLLLLNQRYAMLFELLIKSTFVAFGNFV